MLKNCLKDSGCCQTADERFPEVENMWCLFLQEAPKQKKKTGKGKEEKEKQKEIKVEVEVKEESEFREDEDPPRKWVKFCGFVYKPCNVIKIKGHVCALYWIWNIYFYITHAMKSTVEWLCRFLKPRRMSGWLLSASLPTSKLSADFAWHYTEHK